MKNENEATPTGTPGCSCDGRLQALADAAAKCLEMARADAAANGREIAQLDAVVEDLQSRITTLDVIDGVPMVRMLDGDGNEVMRGWYVRHESRQPSVIDDELRVVDVDHLVLHDACADWNMPRKLIATRVTPPHTIEVIA
ncbi:MAG: hypothetical protein RSB16_02910 [Raoultibacter sp.]